MGVQFDKEVKEWKANVEMHCLLKEVLGHVEEHLDEQERIKQECIPEGFHTTNISSLELTFPSVSLAQDICQQDRLSTDSDLDSLSTDSNLEEMNDDFLWGSEDPSSLLSVAEAGPITHHLSNKCGVTQEAHESLSNFVTSHGMRRVDTLDKMDICSLKASLSENKPPSYQIIGDNVDLYIKTKHMASDKQNKSIHWFGMNAVQDRVYLTECSNSAERKSALDIENSDFLPSSEDNSRLLNDFIPLVARVLADKVPMFETFKKVVIRHIPHKYSHQMKKKSVQVRNFTCNAI